MKQKMADAVEKHPESYSYKNYCGRSKKILYKDALLHSSWEYEVAVWLDNHNIQWTRKVLGFKYFWSSSIRTYYPDFYLPDLNLYLEIKGYKTDRDLEKWKSIKNLVVFEKDKILEIKNNKLSPDILRGREHFS